MSVALNLAFKIDTILALPSGVRWKRLLSGGRDHAVAISLPIGCLESRRDLVQFALDPSMIFHLLQP